MRRRIALLWRSLRPYRAALIVLAVLITTLAIAAGFASPVRDQLRLSFTRSRSAYTELYFLPDTPSVESTQRHRVLVTVPFGLTNRSSGVAQYQYLSRLVDADSGDVVASEVGSGDIDAQGTAAITSVMSVPRSKKWSAVEVEVEVAGAGAVEHIRFMRSSMKVG